MKKMLMTATVPSMIGQFNINNIQILLDLGYQVHVACDFNDRSVWTKQRVEEFKRQMHDMHVVYHQIDYARNPFKIHKTIIAYRQMCELIKSERFHFIHCHTPVAGVIARMAAHKHHVKVIYTAHGFHFYDGAPKKNWLMYYPIEKLFSSWTDVLITINQEDFNRAKKEFNAKRMIYVPGVGVDTARFSSKNIDIKQKRLELGCSDDDFILLSVGELSERKNHKVIIQAVAKSKEKRIKYLIVGKGELEHELKNLAKELGVEDRIRLLGYRTDVNEILSAIDAFVFPSLQEGLPVALMEAMAAGKPVICSKIRGNVDLIEDSKGGYLVQPSDEEAYADSITSLKSFEIRQKMSAYNRKKIEAFDISAVQTEMRRIYEIV